MALRPPRAAFSVARRMGERARAAEPPAEGGGISGMMEALRGLAEKLAAAAQQAGEQQADEHSFSIGKGDTRMVFGYSVRMGRDGAEAEAFGNVPPRAGKPVAPEARQPITDVLVEESEIVVVAELPGADAESIACQVSGRRLLIEAGGARRYRKEVDLPADVRQSAPATSFRNGILEVRLPLEAGA